VLNKAKEVTQPSENYIKALNNVTQAQKEFSMIEKDFKAVSSASAALDNAKRCADVSRFRTFMLPQLIV
jgi:hypothetical protein